MWVVVNRSWTENGRSSDKPSNADAGYTIGDGLLKPRKV